MQKRGSQKINQVKHDSIRVHVKEKKSRKLHHVLSIPFFKLSKGLSLFCVLIYMKFTDVI